MLIEKDNIINFYLNKSIQIKRYKIKINNIDLLIPKYKDYNNILNIDYNLMQLKKINKHYNLKVNGNKDELRKKCYNFLYYSYYTHIIQKKLRNFFIMKYNKLHGPAFINRKLCINDIDFCTLDNINEIKLYNFFSFKDEDGYIYGFDIVSIYNLYMKNSNKFENPFNTKLIDCKFLINLIEIIRLSKIFKIELDLNYEKIEYFNETKKLDFKLLELFQKIDSLGNYTNINWFNSLNKYNLIIFFKELFDIWKYRAMLSNDIKLKICPPHGNPFRNISFNINNINSCNYNVIKKNIINVMDELVTKGINNEYKSLGASYILCSLTLVNNDAAEALPHLYWSVNSN